GGCSSDLPAPIPSGGRQFDPDSLRDLGSQIQAGLRQPDGELLTPDAAGDIPGTNLLSDDASEMHQGSITSRMTQSVVEVLEPVDVGVYQRTLLSADESERFIETPAVVQTGERVDRGGPLV